MNNGRPHLVASLLGVIALMLALHLVVASSGTARAQAAGADGQDAITAPPTVVAGTVMETRVYRFWSDGAVDVSFLMYGGPCEADNKCTHEVVPGR